MSVATFEGVVEGGQIKLTGGVRLPDHTGVYVIVPAGQPANNAHSASPRLINPALEQEFVMEVSVANPDEPAYQYLESRPDKNSRELFLRGRGIRASTIWHDRFVSQCAPASIASDRELPLAAVYEVLDYCQRHWEIICAEKDQERQWLEQKGFFEATSNR